MFMSPLDLCSYVGEDMSLRAERRMYDLFINLKYAECHSIDTMSNGNMSPFLGENVASWVPCQWNWN